MNAKKSPSRGPTPPPTQEQVAALAYAIWVDRGRPAGLDLDHWLEAERQLAGDVRRPAAADELPADERALDPEAALEGPVEREIARIATPTEQRSPTSL